MKRINWIMGLITAVALISGCAPKGASSPTPTPNPVYVSAAEKFVDDLALGDTSTPYAQFDTVMQQAITEVQLGQLWEQLLAQSGNYLGRYTTQSEVAGQYYNVNVGLHFENGDVGFLVTFDAEGKIAGLHIVQAPNTPTATPFVYAAPSYVDINSFTESDVTVGSGEWALPGTLSIPKGQGPFPAVILVHGSGPNDRDETILSNKPFKDIAWGLASRGILVLRYDKRTLVHANLLTPEVLKTFTLQQETIDDALLAVQLLRTRNEVDKNQIYVLGHSLGAMAAPRIGKQDTTIAGLIIMASPTRPLQDILLEQYSYVFSLDGKIADAEQKYLTTLKTQVDLVNSPELNMDTPSSDLPLGASAAYWLDIRDYNPAITAASLNMRLFVLQGERDYQVTPDNLDGWRSALSGKENTKITLYPELNHLFISGTGRPSPEDYSTPGHVAEEVITDIANWIKNQ